MCKQGQQLDVSENKCMHLYKQVVMADRVVELGRGLDEVKTIKSVQRNWSALSEKWWKAVEGLKQDTPHKAWSYFSVDPHSCGRLG